MLLRRSLSPVLALTLLAIAAPNATAARATSEGLFGAADFIDDRAPNAGNQTNVVTIAPESGNIRFTDSSVPILGEGDCQEASGSARCPAANVEKILVHLHGGDDSVFAGSVSDDLFVLGGAGIDSGNGGSGDDFFSGGPGNDTFNAGPGDDVLQDDPQTFGSGADGNDSFNGSAGDDLIHAGALPGAGAGGDTLTGGTNTVADTIDYTTRTARIVVSLDGVANDGAPGEGDNVSGFERFLSGSGSDTITGSPGAERIYGAGGDDELRGGGGADLLFGADETGANASGNDSFDGGPGGDRYAGGDGADRADYTARLAPVTVTIDDVADDGETGEGDNVMGDVERVDGGSAGDSLTGDSGANTLNAGGGGDTVVGAGGDDGIDGGPGTDDLKGGSGDDSVAGGPENDTLDAGSGNDVVSGGEGDDVIAARDGAADAISCEGGSDSVVADAADTVAGDCEAVDRPVVPEGPGNGGGGGGTGVIDTVGPVLKLGPSRAAVTKKGVLKVTVSCPATETAGCSGTLSISSVRRTKKPKVPAMALGRANFAVGGGARKTVKIKLPRKGLALVKRLRSVRATLAATARDGAGNSSSTKKTIVVLRPR